MTKRTLTLKPEHLGELTADDLRSVVGGSPTQIGPDTVFQCQEPGPTLPLYWCVLDRTVPTRSA